MFWQIPFLIIIIIILIIVTGESRESTFLFQQLSFALQRGNVVALLNTFDSG